MKKLYATMNFYLVLGLVAGVFYREYTKIMNFTGETALASVHSHLLVLGFIFFLLLIVVDKVLGITHKKYFNAFYILYNIGIISFVGTMTYRGILDVNGYDFNGLSHMAGLTHVILALGILFFSLNIKQAIGSGSKKAELKLD